MYFHSKHNHNKFEWEYVVLLALAIGCHPYFLPMIFGIFCANVSEALLNKVNPKRVLLYSVATFVPCILVGWIIGAIGVGVSSDGGVFGYYSMNINAIVNPWSFGNILWSNVFKPLPMILGNYVQYSVQVRDIRYFI